MADFTDKYKELGLIGRGAYGAVFKARNNVTGSMVALKRIKILANEDGMPMSTMREISLLKLFDGRAHPNIVRLYDVFHTLTGKCDGREHLLTLVFEHIGQDLSQFLDRYPPPGVPEHIIKEMMQQLLSAIDFLHLNRMVHRDLKPQNILITSNMQIKVADFGLARIHSLCRVLTSVVVTLWYRAPEVLLQSSYDTSVDLWSVGCIFAEMYNRRPLFPGRSDGDQLNRILAVIGAPLESEWPENVSLPWSVFEQYATVDFSLWKYLVPDMSTEGKALLKSLLEFNPAKRIIAKEALQHSYFHGQGSPDSQDSGIALSQEEDAVYENIEDSTPEQCMSNETQCASARMDSPKMARVSKMECAAKVDCASKMNSISTMDSPLKIDSGSKKDSSFNMDASNMDCASRLDSSSIMSTPDNMESASQMDYGSKKDSPSNMDYASKLDCGTEMDCASKLGANSIMSTPVNMEQSDSKTDLGAKKDSPSNMDYASKLDCGTEICVSNMDCASNLDSALKLDPASNMDSSDENDESHNIEEEEDRRRGSLSVKRKRDEVDGDVDADQVYRYLSR